MKKISVKWCNRCPYMIRPQNMIRPQIKYPFYVGSSMNGLVTYNVPECYCVHSERKEPVGITFFVNNGQIPSDCPLEDDDEKINKISPGIA